jgi:copper chaperone CopZ
MRPRGREPDKEKTMADTLTFDVKGMTCDNCVHHVTEAIKNVPGVTTVEVSLSAKSAKVEGSPDPAKVVAAVEEEGYEAALKG